MFVDVIANGHLSHFGKGFELNIQSVQQGPINASSFSNGPASGADKLAQRSNRMRM
jgi:hypothetical protein